MVADGAHILLSLSLVLVIFRTRRAEPYLVAVLAASFPDVDIFVLHPLVENGYVDGVIWTHRGLTHSLSVGVLLILILSYFGPWRPAVVGFFSHVFFDFLTGGVRLFAPLDSSLYGFTVDWTVANVIVICISTITLFTGLFYMKHGYGFPTPSLEQK